MTDDLGRKTPSETLARTVVAGASGAMAAYSGGWMGFRLGVEMFDLTRPEEGFVTGALSLLPGLLMAGVLLVAGALVLWLVVPSVLAALLRWPHIGAALGWQVLLGVVFIPVVTWGLVELDQTTNTNPEVFWVVAILTMTAIPAVSRWYVEHRSVRGMSE